MDGCEYSWQPSCLDIAGEGTPDIAGEIERHAAAVIGIPHLDARSDFDALGISVAVCGLAEVVDFDTVPGFAVCGLAECHTSHHQ